MRNSQALKHVMIWASHIFVQEISLHKGCTVESISNFLKWEIHFT